MATCIKRYYNVLSNTTLEMKQTDIKKLKKEPFVFNCLDFFCFEESNVAHPN